MRAMRKLLAVAIILAATTIQAQIADGDAQWALRAEGRQSGRAKATHVDAAIAAYQRAVAQNLNDLEARWKLLRTMRFKGQYVAATSDGKEQIHSGARKGGEGALALLDKQLAAKGVKSSTRATEHDLAEAARPIR